MEELQPPLPDGTGRAETSLGTRLTNIFIAPSETFDEIRKAPPTVSNWVAPLAAAMVVGLVFVMVVFSQPAIIQGMKDAQEQVLQRRVAAGKITAQQASAASSASERFMTPTVFKIFGIIMVVFGQPFGLFLFALVFWVIGRWALHGDFDFMKAVEAVGVTLMISIVGTIVTMLLAVIYGNLNMTPGPVLLVSHFDAQNPLHKLLAQLNAVQIWYMIVIAIGLARMSNSSLMKGALWVFGLWALLLAITIGLPMLFQ